MQSAASDPAVVAVVEDPSVEVDVSCDLLTDDGWTDISDDLFPDGSSVELDSYRTIHRTCQVGLSRRLDWGKDRIRLRMTLTSPSGGFEASLGVFVLSTPETAAGEHPRTFQVEGYDLLELLDQPHGATHSVASGVGYLAAARTLVEAAGLTVTFGDEGSDRLLGAARVWPLDEQTTTLSIVNDLLSAVGYRGLYVTASGVARSEPYQTPAERGSEWTYDADADGTTVGASRTAIHDFFDAPNRLVAVSDDPENPVGPVTLDNVSDGVTSQDARGRVIPAVERFEAADLAGLTAQANALFDVLSRVAETYEVEVSPNPLHGHMDVVTYRDADLGAARRCLVRSWSLPLDGSDMTLDMRAVDATSLSTSTPGEEPPVGESTLWSELESTWSALGSTWETV